MKKYFLAAGLLLVGFGCNSKPMPESTTVDTNVAGPVVSSSMEAEVKTTTPPPVESKKLAVERSFTLDEIESEGNGGVKEWFRQLARANVAGKKTLVRIPVNHIQGFGCLVPTEYCASTFAGGCYGPYLDLKGDKSRVANAPGTLWAVEGYVVAASKVPDYPEDDERSCAEGELIYDFEVTRTIEKLPQDEAELFVFTQFK